MNKQQNITKKQKDAHIRELELENSLLKQKIAMIGNIIGMNDTYKNISFIGEKMEKAQPIATVWRSGDKVVFQSNSQEDKELLESTIEKQSKKVSELVADEVVGPETQNTEQNHG